MFLTVETAVRVWPGEVGPVLIGDSLMGIVSCFLLTLVGLTLEAGLRPMLNAKFTTSWQPWSRFLAQGRLMRSNRRLMGLRKGLGSSVRTQLLRPWAAVAR